jgi:hypothetical protein
VTETWENFFKHENHAYPPSLSQLGKLRFGTKSDLGESLYKFCSSTGDTPSVDVIILDGAAIINMLKPVGVKTFQKYATLVYQCTAEKYHKSLRHLRCVSRRESEVHSKREARKGHRRRVGASNTIPGNCQEFLKLEDNKTELFNFLALQVNNYHYHFLNECLHVINKMFVFPDIILMS